jgi:hypothetical protein
VIKILLLEGFLIDPNAVGGISLGVAIYEEGSLLRCGQGCREVYGRCRFANATFLIGYTYDFLHYLLQFFIGI